MSEQQPTPRMRNAVDLGVVGENILDIADFAIEKYEFSNDTTLSEEAREEAVERIREALWEMVKAHRKLRKQWLKKLFDAADGVVRDLVKEP